MTEDKDNTRSCDEAAQAHAAARRRPYTSPVLTEYGSIARLTQTGGSTAKEGGVPAMKKNCL